VNATFGSSGNLYAQLTNKAPFDLFFSADLSYPRRLIDAGLADQASEFLYAYGHLVVWVPNGSPVDLETRGVEAVTDASVRRLAIANPAHAPYGRAADAALKQLGIYDRVKDRLVLGENIAQTAQFVESGAADAGIIALSLALSPAMKDKGRSWKVPQHLHPRLEQGGVILNWARDRHAAEAFRGFILSDEGKAILRRYGFEPPQTDASLHLAEPLE
jgi:molybdate transport system substrate-binding protein